MLRILFTSFPCFTLLSSVDGFLVPTSLASSVSLSPSAPASVACTSTANVADVLSPHQILQCLQYDSLVLSVGNIGSEVGDSIRSIIFGIAGLLAAIFFVAVLYTTLMMPKQVEGLENMLKDNSPEKYQELASKLKEGETFMSRPDLMEALVDVGTSEIAKVGDDELKLVLERVKREKEEYGLIDMEKLEDDVTKLVGMPVEEYIKAETEFEKNKFLQNVPVFAKFLTETDKELCALLREEMATKRATNE